MQRIQRCVAGDAQQLFAVDDLHLRCQLACGLRLYAVSAVIAHRGPGAETLAAVAQQIEAAEGIAYGLFAVEHGVHAAAVRIELYHPLVIPQLALQLCLREDGCGGGAVGGLGAGGHIVQGGLFLGGVHRRTAQKLRITAIVVQVILGVSTICSTGAPEESGLVGRNNSIVRQHGDLPLSVHGTNICHVSGFLSLGQSTIEHGDGDGHQHGDDRHDDQHLHQSEALLVVEFFQHVSVSFLIFLYRPAVFRGVDTLLICRRTG